MQNKRKLKEYLKSKSIYQQKTGLVNDLTRSCYDVCRERWTQHLPSQTSFCAGLLNSRYIWNKGHAIYAKKLSIVNSIAFFISKHGFLNKIMYLSLTSSRKISFHTHYLSQSKQRGVWLVYTLDINFYQGECNLTSCQMPGY